MHYFKFPFRVAATTLIGTGMFALTGLAHAQVQAPSVEEPHPVDSVEKLRFFQ